MKPAFDTKTSRLDVLSVRLHIADLTELEEFLRRLAGQLQDELAPFISDVQDFDHPESIDLGGMISLFACYGMQILGLHHISGIWAAATARYHLAFKQGDATQTADTQATSTPRQAPQSQDVQAIVISNPTASVSTPVRTGQQVYAENGDLAVTGIVSQGAELTVDDNIHIYAPTRGRALAGAKGNTNVCIFIYPMQAELVSVVGIYCDFEQSLPEYPHKKSVQVSLQDNRLVISAIDVG